MSVRADERTVKTNVARFECRDDREFGRKKIVLGDAVLFMEQCQDIQFDGIAFKSRVKGAAADEHIQFFTGNGISQRFFIVLVSQMGQKVVDIEDRVAVVFAHADIHTGTVFLHHNAVQRKRGGHPLIFTDAPVIVSLEETHAVFFIERALFEIKTGRINVRGRDPDTLAQRLAADGEKEEIFAAVIIIIFAATFQLVTERVRFKALFFGQRYGSFHRLAFGFGRVKEGGVSAREVIGRIDMRFVFCFVDGFLFVGKLLTQFFCVFHLNAPLF